MNTYETILQRRTIRKFSQTQIPDENLKKYVNAARLAPSGANLQPVKYVIVQSADMVQKVFSHVRWAAYIAPEGNPKKGEEPTAFVAILADTAIRSAGYEADMGAAVASFILAAEEDGVGACWMGSIDYEKISELLELAPEQKLLCVVALGYKAEQPVAVEMDNDIKYYKDEHGVLHVPKRKLDEVLVSVK